MRNSSNILLLIAGFSFFRLVYADGSNALLGEVGKTEVDNFKGEAVFKVWKESFEADEDTKLWFSQLREKTKDDLTTNDLKSIWMDDSIKTVPGYFRKPTEPEFVYMKGIIQNPNNSDPEAWEQLGAYFYTQNQLGLDPVWTIGTSNQPQYLQGIASENTVAYRSGEAYENLEKMVKMQTKILERLTVELMSLKTRLELLEKPNEGAVAGGTN